MKKEEARPGRPSPMKWLLAVLSVAVIAIALFVYLFFNPADWVEVRIREIPPNIPFVCVVAETEDGPRALEWYIKKVFPATMPPRDSTISEPAARRHKANVRWIKARRYGILARRPGKWVVWWEKEGRELRKGGLPILGGGKAEFSLGEREPVVVKGEFLTEVGIPEDRHFP